jgi:isoleucyl-tRNA synthetase
MMTTPSPPETPNYKQTLQLPETTFPMRAGATVREPEIQAFWEEHDVYKQVLAQRSISKKFILHDGPPYLSSENIHIGTALNKILKDIVIRFKNLQGFYTPYVPGYDGHGLPIEAAVEKKIKGGRKAVSPLELREKCRAFAHGNLKGQETNFKRLGISGHWESPYLTIDADFEARQIELFAEMVKKGYVYKGLKPVHWCPVSESAMAEAEIEYADVESHSIHVLFPLKTLEKAYGNPLSPEQSTLLTDASILIWTTTPWTLPSNVALAVHPAFEYTVLQTEAFGKIVVATDRLEPVENLLKQIRSPIKLGTLKGTDLAGLQANHPFTEGKKSVVLNALFVTLDAGTGIVHIAPGHGPDDFQAVQSLNREHLQHAPLPILSPIDGRGVFMVEPFVPEAVQGQFYEKANWVILDILKAQNALVHHYLFTHSYPHSWRAKTPVIFRATEQWFINVNAFRETALAEIKTVQWIPERGQTRISTMVANRAEWCISRQRLWGVPIPAFYTPDGQTHLTPEITALVAQLFREETSDAWVKYPTPETLIPRLQAILPTWETLPARQKTGFSVQQLEAALAPLLAHPLDTLRKEEDVMDVWFDSGVTHTTVVEARKELLGDLPAELYLEGSDQHRGWFQSSLLTSVMLNEKAPYKAVLTHGFVLDENGRKMSKSLGNVVDPNTVMKEYGADVLRLWVASVDFTNDVRIGKGALKQLADIYRKIRNTLRFLLGNLAGFNPATDAVPYETLSSLDKYVLHRVALVSEKITQAFAAYEFHKFYQLVQNLCVVELSSLYFDIVKDILYCNAKTDTVRLGVQTVLYEVLLVLSRLIIPVMPHLAEDLWSHWSENQRPNFGFEKPPVSILMAPWPEIPTQWKLAEADAKAFEALLSLRETVNVALEDARSKDLIGSALEAAIIIQPLSADWDFLSGMQEAELETLFLVSQVHLQQDADPKAVFGRYAVLAEQEVEGEYRVFAVQAAGKKCDRCWQYCETVGQFADHPTICHRCHQAV